MIHVPDYLNTMTLNGICAFVSHQSVVLHLNLIWWV